MVKRLAVTASLTVAASSSTALVARLADGGACSPTGAATGAGAGEGTGLLRREVAAVPASDPRAGGRLASVT